MAKVNLFPDFKEFLKSLNSAGVEYMLIGGYAVAHHGYERVTKDIDVWVATTSENAAKVSGALQAFAGFPPESVPPDQFEQVGKVFAFGREPVRIDILTGPDGVTFAECYGRRSTVDWDGISVPLIALDDLKANKLASGRAKDLADLENLPPSPTSTKKAKSRRRKPR
jgi:predicted nucleotidyltransferase